MTLIRAGQKRGVVLLTRSKEDECPSVSLDLSCDSSLYLVIPCYTLLYLVIPCYTLLYLVIPVQRQCHVMSLVVGIQGQKAYGLCKTPLCAELVVQFSP